MVKAFRPISLMSFLLKTLKRLVDRFIRDDTLIKYPLNENQHAYMAGKYSWCIFCKKSGINLGVLKSLW